MLVGLYNTNNHTNNHYQPYTQKDNNMTNDNTLFEVENWAINAYSLRTTIHTETGAVSLSVSWDSGRWDIDDCQDSHGNQLDTDKLAQSLGYRDDYELLGALTDDLFAVNHYSAQLLRPVSFTR